MCENTGAPPEGPPPADFAAFRRDVWAGRLLGGPPAGQDSDRPGTPSRWPQDKAGAEFLFRGLARLLWERGGTMQAADSIRRDLETGAIVAVVIDDCDGARHPIEASRWEAANTSRLMYWTGRAHLRHAAHRDARGDVYLTTAQPAPEPVEGDAPDLRTRERTTVHKLLLAAVADAYGVVPGKRSDAAKQIAMTSERLWPGAGLSERTVRAWLKSATEELGPPAPGEP